MHNVKFKTLTFRNFMSYGNNLNTFNFTDGLIWFAADNGFGKSTIVEALNFVLFGDSYRGGNKGDLRNTRNPTCDLMVSLEFSVDDGDSEDVSEYRIFRTMKPSGASKFDLEKMENGQWVPQNKRAGYSQKDFEELVIGFNEVLFKNVIAMNTQETVPFIQMPAAKKRELLESIIAMSLDSWKKENSKRMSTANVEFDVANADYSRLGNEIVELNKIIARMEEERQGNVAQLKASQTEVSGIISDLLSKIDSKNVEIQSQDNVVGVLRQKCSAEKGLKQQLDKMNTVYDAIKIYDNLATAFKEAKAKYDEAEEKADPNLSDYQVSLQKATTELTGVQTDVKTYNNSISRMEWKIESLKTQQDEVTKNANEMKPGVPCPTCGKPSTEADVEVHKSELRKKWKELNKQIGQLNTGIKSNQDKLAEANGKVSELTDKISDLKSKLEKCSTYSIGTLAPLRQIKDDAARKLDKCIQDIGSSDQSKLDEKLEEVKNIISNISTELDSISEARQQMVTEQTTLANLNGDLRVLRSDLETNKRKYNELASELNRLENAQNDDALGTAKTRLANAISEKDSAKNRMSEKSDTIEICKFISDMCSDGGMKKMIFGLFVPAFNTAVQKNIIQANLPFTITFDDTMDFSFKSAPGDSPTYTMCSQGQKRKIGFAISMAFRDFVSLVGNFKINFLSLDEVLDISTDDNAMRAMLDLVKDMVGEIGCAAVITHRGPVVADKFDYKITITHDGAYSRIGNLQKL